MQMFNTQKKLRQSEKKIIKLFFQESLSFDGTFSKIFIIINKKVWMCLKPFIWIHIFQIHTITLIQKNNEVLIKMNLPIFVQITTIRLATTWLSSTRTVFTVPSNIRTRSVRIFLLYSRRSWKENIFTKCYF